MSKHAAEFVALVTDGQVIDGFGKRCEKCGQPTEEGDGRKDKFLKLGRAVMKDLAKLLGLGPKDVNVNPAGPALSGDVYIFSPHWYVSFSVWKDRSGFFVRYGGVNGIGAFSPWEELLDLPKVVERLVALKGKTPCVPVGVSIEQLGGTAQVVDVLEALENDLDADEARESECDT